MIKPECNKQLKKTVSACLCDNLIGFESMMIRLFGWHPAIKLSVSNNVFAYFLKKKSACLIAC